MNLDIATLKRHLSIEQEFTTDDILLQNCLDTATIVVANYLDIPVGESLPSVNTVNPAIILLAANYYANRNMVSFGNASEMPYSFKFMLNAYRNIAIG